MNSTQEPHIPEQLGEEDLALVLMNFDWFGIFSY